MFSAVRFDLTVPVHFRWSQLIMGLPERCGTFFCPGCRAWFFEGWRGCAFVCTGFDVVDAVDARFWEAGASAFGFGSWAASAD